MGRSIKPMLQEEFEKLPKWQQWLSHNALWVFPLGVIIAVGIGYALSRI